MNLNRRSSSFGLLSDSRVSRHLGIAAGLILIILIIGTIGFMLAVDNLTVIDGLFLTVITMSTVGYHVPDLTGSGKIFVVVLIISSLGIVGYSLSAVAAFILEGELRTILKGRRMDRRISALRDHIILCGCGHTGRCIAQEFFKTNTSFIIVDRDERVLNQLEHADEMLFMSGDATDDAVLEEAGIRRARGLVTVLSDDKDNVFVVLSARSLNKNLRIITRVMDETNAGKLMKAGADQVVSPYRMGGLRMASAMVRPAVLGFLDRMLNDPDNLLRMEDVLIARGSNMVGKTLGELGIGQRIGAMVVAVRGEQGEFVFNPRGSTRIGPESVLVVLGSPDQIEQVEMEANDSAVTKRIRQKRSSLSIEKPD